MHWITGDCEMGVGTRLTDTDKRGPGGCSVLLSDLVLSLAKCVDMTAAPEGFRLAAGTSMFVLLQWDFSTLMWVLCKPRTQQYSHGDKEGMGGGACSEGGLQQFMQPDNIVSTLMAHTLGGSWSEGKSFHESSIAYVQSGGEHYLAYVGIPMQSSIVMVADLNLDEEFRVEASAGSEDLLDWFDFDLSLGQDIVLDDLNTFDNDVSHDEPQLDKATPVTDLTDHTGLTAPPAPEEDSMDQEMVNDAPTLHTPVLSPSKPAFSGFDFLEEGSDAEMLSQANTPVASQFRQQAPPDFTKTLVFSLEPVPAPVAPVPAPVPAPVAVPVPAPVAVPVPAPVAVPVPAPVLPAPAVARAETDVSGDIGLTLQIAQRFQSRLAETLAECLRFKDDLAKAKHVNYKWL